MTHRDSFDSKLHDALDQLNALDAVKRMVARDTSLWSDDASVQSKVHNRLGWLFHLPEMRQQLKRLNEFVRLVERRGHDRVVVIGMGGSSLFPEVIARHLRSKKSLGLQVLDSTHPAALESVRAWAAEGSPLFLVATKSGGTLETLSLYQRMRAHFPDGARYVAITDPGSPLVQMAKDEGFLETFLNPADIGGRFSATSLFGLVPAALTGVDLNVALDAAEQMLEDCSAIDAHRNPGAQLAAFLFAAHESQRWLLRLSFSRDIEGFAAWVEQLVAESTGKRGQGLLPIPGNTVATDHPSLSAVAVVGTRTFAHPDDAFVEACEDRGVPVYDVVMPAKTDLWAEVVRWEVATALVGALLEQNPFDEPDVSAAKAAAQQILSGQSAPRPADRELVVPSVKALTKALEPELAEAGADEALAVLAYLPPTESNLHRLSALRDRLQQNTSATVTVSVGPRYLHSTGQLHKGGRPACRFVLLHDHDQLEACSASPDLAEIIRAQALGDVMVLKDRGRHVSLARLGGN